MKKMSHSKIKIHDPFFQYSVVQDVCDLAMSTGAHVPSVLGLGQIYGACLDPVSDLDDLTYVVFDFETTGLSFDFDRIIEIGAIKWRKGDILDTFEQLVFSDVPIQMQAQIVTGLTDADLADAPKMDEVLPKFLDFIKGSVLVAHNAQFDMGMLKATCRRYAYHTFFKGVCTLKMSRAFLKLPNYKLDTLAAHYGLSFEARHRSLGDVKVTTSVFERLLDEFLKGKKLQDVEEFMIA